MSSFNEFDPTLNSAMFAMETMLRKTPRHELFGSVLAFCWLLGGLLGDSALFLVSMSLTLVLFTFSLLSNIFNIMKSMGTIHVSSFRRLIIGLLAHWTYTSGKTQGSDTYSIFGSSIPILLISQGAVAYLFLIWMITKYGENIDKNGFQLKSTPFLFVRGLLRGIILLCALFAIVNFEIHDFIAIALFGAYIVEPYVYYIWASFNRSISSTDMVLGENRLPTVALRESFLSNLVYLFITMSFHGVKGSEWDLLRVYYILGFMYFLFASWDDIKKFNQNPLASSLAGEFLQNTPAIMNQIDFSQQKGIVIDKDRMINLGNSINMDIKPGSILVPLEEQKGKVSAMIIGKANQIVEQNGEKVSELRDGISTVLVPASQIKSLKKEFFSQALDKIDFTELNLPDLTQIQNLVSQFSSNLGNWVASISKELKKFDLTNYGVKEIDGMTFVNLPGISVVDGGKDIQSVKVGPIRVLETPNAQIVKIGGFINVLEFPKVSFVSLPGITVVDVPTQGSAVDIFGFKVSDELPAEYLDEFKGAFQQYMSTVEQQVDDQLGKILASDKASISLNMTWDGEFQPLLKGGKGMISGPLELSSGMDTKSLPPGKQTDKNENKLVSLAGLNELREGRSRKHGRRSREDKDKAKLERAQRKLERIQKREAKRDARVQAKLDKISQKLDDTRSEINGDSPKEIPHKKPADSGDDYEILDD